MINSTIEDIKATFRGNNGLAKIIIITIITFVASNIVDAVVAMAGGGSIVSEYFGLPAGLIDFVFQPWSIFTYMFLHGGIMHILFNMLWLYWLGRILTEYIGNQSFINIYFIGGMAGGALYLLIYNIVDFIAPGNSALNINSSLIGASGGVLAVVTACGTLIPNNSLNLMFIGPVKLKYIAVGSVILTSLIDLESNTGGKIAHLGGVIYGYYYIRKRQRGIDVGIWFNRITATFSSLFKPKPKMKVAFKKTKSDIEYNTNKVNEQKQVDIILDKISKSGYDSLTKEEKDFLFRVSNRK